MDVTALAGSPIAMLALFALALLDSFVPPVPSELAMISCVAAATSAGEPWWRVAGLVAATMVGIMSGDLMVLRLGRLASARPGRFPRLDRALGATRATFAQHGPALVLSGRFLPGWRIAVTLGAGASGMGWRRFLLLDGASVLTWGLVHGSLAATSGTVLRGSPWAAVVLGTSAGLVVGLVIERLARLGRPRCRVGAGEPVTGAVAPLTTGGPPTRALRHG